MFEDLHFYEQKWFLFNVKRYILDELYLFKECEDNVIRQCVPEEKANKILKTCHSSSIGGHHCDLLTAAKILQSGYHWESF